MKILRIKKNSPPVTIINEANATRSLCVLLVLDAIVSYRSIPRILSVVNQHTSHHQNYGLKHVFKTLVPWANGVIVDLAKKHNEIQEKIKLPLLVSSDIIESLFGNFTYIMERSPRADMNRTVLLIPALCGKRSESSLQQSLSLVRHHDLQAWDEENIPYTIRRNRSKFCSQKVGT